MNIDLHFMLISIAMLLLALVIGGLAGLLMVKSNEICNDIKYSRKNNKILKQIYKLNNNEDINEFMVKGYSLNDSIKLVQQAKNVYKCGEQYGLTYEEAKFMVLHWMKG